jgi:hypothetical protein
MASGGLRQSEEIGKIGVVHIASLSGDDEDDLFAEGFNDDKIKGLMVQSSRVFDMIGGTPWNLLFLENHHQKGALVLNHPDIDTINKAQQDAYKQLSRQILISSKRFSCR